jgi:hypothetical protein
VTKRRQPNNYDPTTGTRTDPAPVDLKTAALAHAEAEVRLAQALHRFETASTHDWRGEYARPARDARRALRAAIKQEAARREEHRLAVERATHA